MAQKHLTKTQQIKNCLTSDLQNMVTELKLGTLSEECIYSYFSTMFVDAGVDSRIVVDVLESVEFGELGNEAAMSIKVNEGW